MRSSGQGEVAVMGGRLGVLACVLAGCSTLVEPLPSEPVDAAADSGMNDPDALIEAGTDSAVISDASDAHVSADGNTAAAGGDSGDEGGTGGVSGSGGSGGSGGTGPTCECNAVSDCCDGCDFVDDATECDDGRSDTREDRCARGVCVGDLRECSTGGCCDGWHFKLAGQLCEDGARSASVRGGRDFTCLMESVCGYRIAEGPVELYCSGNSALCERSRPSSGPTWSESHQCPDGQTCMPGMTIVSLEAEANFSELCIPDPNCN